MRGFGRTWVRRWRLSRFRCGGFWQWLSLAILMVELTTCNVAVAKVWWFFLVSQWGFLLFERVAYGLFWLWRWDNGGGSLLRDGVRPLLWREGVL